MYCNLSDVLVTNEENSKIFSIVLLRRNVQNFLSKIVFTLAGFPMSTTWGRCITDVVKIPLHLELLYSLKCGHFQCFIVQGQSSFPQCSIRRSGYLTSMLFPSVCIVLKKHKTKFCISINDHSFRNVAIFFW